MESNQQRPDPIDCLEDMLTIRLQRESATRGENSDPATSTATAEREEKMVRLTWRSIRLVCYFTGEDLDIAAPCDDGWNEGCHNLLEVLSDEAKVELYDAAVAAMGAL